MPQIVQVIMALPERVNHDECNQGEQQASNYALAKKELCWQMSPHSAMFSPQHT